MIRILFLLLAIQPVTWLQAQIPSDYKDFAAKYPDEPAMYLNFTEAINIGLRDGVLDVTSSHHSRLLFLKEEVGGLANKSISYSSFNEINEIDARTLIPNKERFRTARVEEIRDEDRISGGVFYDDQREKVFVFPGVEKGAIADLKYSEVINEPRFLGAFYFNSFVPVQSSEFQVVVDKGVSLKYILLGEGTDRIRFTENKKGGKTVYTWTASGMDAMKFEANSPSPNYYEPHVIVYIDQYGEPGETEDLLSDVSSLYTWYRSLTIDLNKEPDEDLTELTRNLLDGASTDEEKVRRIFHWVQDNIRYIAFEDGLGGFIPREASLVCTRKYGDCKDMASITTQMLALADVPANLTWIGTRDIPYSYEDVPTPMVDNHMIASVLLGGQRMFLDPTDDFLGFGYPSAFIQGKQALVGKGEDFELVTVPVVPVEDNLISEKANISLQGDEVIGTGISVYNGYPAFNLKRRLKGTRKDRLVKVLGDVLELGNNKFEITSHEITGMENRDVPFEIVFDLKISDYARQLGDEIYVNLHLDRRLNNQLVDTVRRKRDREFEFKYQQVHQVVFNIPEGYEPDYIPANASWSGEKFGFDIKYTRDGDKLILDRTIKIDMLLLEIEAFGDWNQMIRQLDEAYQEVIVLKRQ